MNDELDTDFADMKARANKRLDMQRPKPTKKSDLSLVDQYEQERRMGRFSGSFQDFVNANNPVQKRSGGAIKNYAKGGKIDGCAQRGKTKGRMV
jgi:hypothetical protein